MTTHALRAAPFARPEVSRRPSRSTTHRLISVRASEGLGGGKLEGGYLFAEATVWLIGVLMLTFPEASMGPLVPADAPASAAASGAQALRVVACFAPIIATSLSCLADADVKGNLVKSATYRRLNSGCLGIAITSLALTTLAYQSGGMRSSLLAFAMIAFAGPVAWASWRGGAEQGALSGDALSAAFKEDTASLSANFEKVEAEPIRIFYQSQLALVLVVGAALVLLPAAILESPEATFAGETLMRRVAGLETLWLQGTVVSVLLDASKRNRLGASTFKALNRACGVSTLGVGACLSALLAEVSGANDAAGAYSVGILLPVIFAAVPASVYLYQGVTATKT